MKKDELIAVRDEARSFAATWVKPLAAELIEWQDTGLLTGGKLSELAAIFDKFDSTNSLSLAESTAMRAALDAVVGGEACVCPPELRPLLISELSSDRLRYMLAMCWQGRADKISSGLVPLLEWITRNGLQSQSPGQAWAFQPGKTAFAGQDHQALLDEALGFAQDCVEKINPREDK